MTGPIKNNHTISQAKKIVAYMNRNRYITSYEAVKELGVISLQRRLSDLRESGYIFGNEMVVNQDTGKRYKKYWIVSEPMATKEVGA